MCSSDLDNNEPTSYGEAMVGPDSDKWLEAIKSERGSMYENKVWTLEELLDGRKAVGYRWILKGRRTMVTLTIIVCLPFKIYLYSTALRPSSSSSKVYTLFSYMDPLSGFMALSHLSESGPTIASP